MISENIIILNERVALIPIWKVDFAQLVTLSLIPELWDKCVFAMKSEQDVRDYVEESEQLWQNEQKYTFGILDSKRNVAGSMSLGNYSPYDRRIEIGWSWLGTQFQGTGVNLNAKYALLKLVFETFKALRVEFKTDQLNVPARAGLKKLGATEEGVLRSHTLMHHGRRRDTIFYSLLLSEWLEVKQSHFSSLDEPNIHYQ